MKHKVITGAMTVLIGGAVAGNASAATYEIQSGDTLSEIAQAYNTTVVNLAALNGIEDVNKIYAGDFLEIGEEIIEVEDVDTPTPELVMSETQGDSLIFEVTMYTPHDDPEYGSMTASGATAQEGVTVAASKEIPFGTKIYIPYFGRTYTVQDRGGAIKSGKLDVYVNDPAYARQFGRQKLEAVILQ